MTDAENTLTLDTTKGKVVIHMRPDLAAQAARVTLKRGAVTTETLAAAVGATLPEGTIVVDEGNTSGLFVPGATAGAPRHDWLTLTGGAIGIGLPMATGAALRRSTVTTSRPNTSLTSMT